MAAWISASLVAVALVCAAVGIYATLIEPRRLEVSHVHHATAGLGQVLRIALLTDLQTDDPGPFEARALAATAAADPDLVLFGGDYIHIWDPQEYLAAADKLAAIIRTAGLKPRLGAFAVAGNVDQPEIWQRVFAGTGVVADERTRRFDLPDLVLTTLSLRDSFDTGLDLPAQHRLHVVLGHAPDFSLGRHRAELLVAGHTHGGQVRLPLIGPLITFSQVPRSWAAGATRLQDGGLLVVSRGIGMERGRAPRLRFACRPQVVIIELEPAGPLVTQG